MVVNLAIAFLLYNIHMIDENIDLTLNSIFAGDKQHVLLPQRVRNRIHEKTKSIFKSETEYLMASKILKCMISPSNSIVRLPSNTSILVRAVLMNGRPNNNGVDVLVLDSMSRT